MAQRKYLAFYFISLGILLAASSYPIYMGIITLKAYLESGAINVSDYPKYIIPYTPMCIGILLTAILFPLLYKLFKRYSLLAGSIIGIAAFLISEINLEKIEVITGYTYNTTVEKVAVPLESWQASLCVITPEVYKTIYHTTSTPVYAENNPVFKIHFYLIAIIIITTTIGVIYGFTRMIKTENYEKRRPLIAQLVSLVVFIGLCVLACFTAFYRTGNINVAPISAFLMSLFFIVFGITAGVYFGCLFFRKHKFLSVILPSLMATATTAAMYVGELVLMGGKLFILGSGFLFTPIQGIPFSAWDIIVMILSGAFTAILLLLLNKQKALESSGHQITQEY